MKSFEHAWQAFDKLLWGLGLVFGVLLPVLTYRLPVLSNVLWIELILLLVNGIFSIWIGRYIKRHQLRWATLLIFPLLFLITAYFLCPILLTTLRRHTGQLVICHGQVGSKNKLVDGREI